MRRFAVSFLVMGCLAAMLGGSASARPGSPPQRHLYVSTYGWGSVTPVKGFKDHRERHCTYVPRCFAFLHTRERHLTLTAAPYTGRKFVGWGRACRRAQTRTCRLDASRFLPACPISIPPGYDGRPTDCTSGPFVTAKFVPVAPGLTRKNPIPIGTAHKIGNGYTWRVNSAQANPQLSSAPAAGQEYFDADVTLTYTGPGSSIPLDHLDLNAEGNRWQLYFGDHGGGCPATDLQPRLDLVDPLVSEQSATGNVCWAIATGDASSLEMFFGSGTLDFPPVTTWFALH